MGACERATFEDSHLLATLSRFVFVANNDDSLSVSNTTRSQTPHDEKTMSGSSNNDSRGLYEGRLRSRSRRVATTTATASISSSTSQQPKTANVKMGGGDYSKKSHLSVPHTTSSIVADDSSNQSFASPPATAADDHDDRLNYALLLALYTLQGIPMGLVRFACRA